MIANKELRLEMKKAGLPMWKLGELWGNVSEMTVVRRFRHELPEETKQELLVLIVQAKSLSRNDLVSDSNHDEGKEEASRDTRSQRDLVAEGDVL